MRKVVTPCLVMLAGFLGDPVHDMQKRWGAVQNGTHAHSLQRRCESRPALCQEYWHKLNSTDSEPTQACSSSPACWQCCTRYVRPCSVVAAWTCNQQRLSSVGPGRQMALPECRGSVQNMFEMIRVDMRPRVPCRYPSRIPARQPAVHPAKALSAEDAAGAPCSPSRPA